ncbi:hypothetical protein [Saccharopolyspora shandongensis]|uniref:hypothetical protein n=1 Tax=Saccharopolyspora shandongensis TaxID=418495 RepID=UPI0034118C9E
MGHVDGDVAQQHRGRRVQSDGQRDEVVDGGGPLGALNAAQILGREPMAELGEDVGQLVEGEVAAQAVMVDGVGDGEGRGRQIVRHVLDRISTEMEG